MENAENARELAEQINAVAGLEGPRAAVRGDEITLSMNSPLLLELFDGVAALIRWVVALFEHRGGDTPLGAQRS